MLNQSSHRAMVAPNLRWIDQALASAKVSVRGEDKVDLAALGGLAAKVRVGELDGARLAVDRLAC